MEKEMTLLDTRVQTLKKKLAEAEVLITSLQDEIEQLKTKLSKLEQPKGKNEGKTYTVPKS